MPIVEVRDAEGKLIESYQMAASEYGTLVTEESLIDMARQNVIDDDLASPEQAETLSFSVIEPNAHGPV